MIEHQRRQSGITQAGSAAHGREMRVDTQHALLISPEPYAGNELARIRGKPGGAHARSAPQDLLVSGREIDPPGEMEGFAGLQGEYVDLGRVSDPKIPGDPGQPLEIAFETMTLPPRLPGQDAAGQDGQEPQRVER